MKWYHFLPNSYPYFIRLILRYLKCSCFSDRCPPNPLFKNTLSNCLFQVYKNAISFCMLFLYLSMLLNSPFQFSIESIVSENNVFYFLISYPYVFNLFFLTLLLGEDLQYSLLNRSENSEHSLSSFWSQENSANVFLSIRPRRFPSILKLWRSFYHEFMLNFLKSFFSIY